VDVFSIFTVLGGLAMFLFGMNIMTSGLEKISGGKLERTLKTMTSNPLMGLVLGAAITVAIQSSSATTVMLVGLVNSGIMTLRQSIGVIMGSNIGTTLTAWILGLAGIESGNFFIRLLKPESFSPILAFIGIIMVMLSKNGRKKDVGHIMVGFSVLMYGMTLMSGALKPLADMPQFSEILTMFTNPLLGVLVGAVLTGIVQSSAATVGVLQALSLTGSITYTMAFPIIMGQNIGTCVTAVLSSIGVNRNAKRVSVVHMLFNTIGTIVFLILFYVIRMAGGLAFMDEAVTPFGIALIHSIFNLSTTAMLLPFGGLLEKITRMLVPDKEGKEESYTLLDERFIHTPAFAIEKCADVTVEMAVVAKEALTKALECVWNYNEDIAAQVKDAEDKLDQYEDQIGSYLVKLSEQDLSTESSRMVSKLLHSIGDFERIGDHALNVLEAAQEMNQKGISFSGSAEDELKILFEAVKEVVYNAVAAFEKDDVQLANLVEPLEQVIDGLKLSMRARHVERLQRGQCTIELGFIFSDLITNLERVSDHCSNVAACMIEVKQGNFDMHEYVHSVKSGFEQDYQQYREKYMLPNE